jgi:peptide/nickel transport system substrate-binding protein
MPERNDPRRAFDVDAGTLDPRLARDTSAYRLRISCNDGLVRLFRGLKPNRTSPKAGKIQIPGPGSSSSRDGVTFPRRVAVHRDDVVFTYDTT